MTKLSVIVPVYNVETYLEKCLDSLVNQTYKDLEIIVVNDGSTDRSQKIIDKYSKDYPKLIKPFLKENGGLSDARNYGLKHAQGEFVAFVDSDDYVDLNLFEMMINKIVQTNADIAVCDLLYEYDSKEVKVSSGGDFKLSEPDNDTSVLQLNNSACNKVIRKTLIDQFPFIKGIWYEDLATIPVLLTKANKIVKVNDVYYHYLQREGSIVHTENPKIFDIHLALNNIKNNIDDKYISDFNEMYINQAIFLTNLRIKDYSNHRKEYWRKNRGLVSQNYPYWYLNKVVWNQGLKKLIIFTLFNFRQYGLMDKTYRNKG